MLENNYLSGWWAGPLYVAPHLSSFYDKNTHFTIIPIVYTTIFFSKKNCLYKYMR